MSEKSYLGSRLQKSWIRTWEVKDLWHILSYLRCAKLSYTLAPEGGNGPGAEVTRPIYSEYLNTRPLVRDE